MSKVLRENRDNVIEFNACDTTDDFRGKQKKDDLVVYVYQERSVGESKL
jgi:hypothetical protein